MGSKIRLIVILGIILVAGYASFSSSASPEEIISKNVPKAEKQISALNDKLTKGQIPNAYRLEKYLDYLQQNHPEHQVIANEFRQELSANNPRIKRFQERLDDVRYTDMPDTKTVQELDAILAGTTADIYNESYIDLLNTVSDLTGNAQPRVNLSDPRSSDSVYQAGNGAHLVGNENYGHWLSFANDKTWIWKGALAGTALYGTYKFSQWSRDRGWSYYNDHGRGLFGSSTARNFLSGYQGRTNNMFKPSSYASPIMGAKSRSCSGSNRYSNSSSCNSNTYYGSHRNSNKSRNRGFFGGK